MIYKADSDYIKLLLELPESGMGYQVIEACKTGSDSPNQFVIFNSELIIGIDSDLDESIAQLVSETYAYTRMFEKAKILQLTAPRLVDRKTLREIRGSGKSMKLGKSRYFGGRGADECRKENATGVEMFVRLSAFEKDNRIDLINRHVIQGAFSTTLVDYLECKNVNDDLIDRFALPLTETINWAFYFKPEKTDQLQKGIVQPAFSLDGGGVEVYFESGTSHRTFISLLPV